VVLGLTDNGVSRNGVPHLGWPRPFLSGNFEQSRNWLDRGLASSGAAYSVWRVNALGSLGLVEAWSAISTEPTDSSLKRCRCTRDRSTRPSSIADAYLARTLILLERGEPNWAATALHDGTLGAAKNRRTQLIGLLDSSMHSSSLRMVTRRRHGSAPLRSQ